MWLLTFFLLNLRLIVLSRSTIDLTVSVTLTTLMTFTKNWWKSCLFSCPTLSLKGSALINFRRVSLTTTLSCLSLQITWSLHVSLHALSVWVGFFLCPLTIYSGHAYFRLILIHALLICNGFFPDVLKTSTYYL